MKPKRILIVDDEKNVRLTLTQALEAEEWETDTAVNGEEALAKLEGEDFDLMLLDLKMPGMDGMEVLRRVAEDRPDVRVIIITAYGTIESAVEAVKLGAVDYLQKPFAPKQIRDLVTQVLALEDLDEEQAKDYDSRLELAKKCINARHFGAAEEHASKAITIDTKRPEAFNLLGALLEMRGDKAEAQKHYRIAVQVDPTYGPARENLHRTTMWEPGTQAGEILLGEGEAKGDHKTKSGANKASHGQIEEER